MSEIQDACKKFKARRDPFALIESGAFKIRTKAGELIPLTPETMHPFQRRAYYSVKEQYQKGKPVRQIWLKSRQMGGSTLAELIEVAVAMLVWAAAGPEPGETTSAVMVRVSTAPPATVPSVHAPVPGT